MNEVRAVKLKFSDLVFLEDNPRTITPDRLERLAGRIKNDPTFFYNRPCLINLSGGKYICYAGIRALYQRYKAEVRAGRNPIGKYATSNIDEFWAEGITQATIGRKQSYYSRQLKKLLKKYG